MVRLAVSHTYSRDLVGSLNQASSFFACSNQNLSGSLMEASHIF
ncbi:MAG: hypothetical protein BWX80_04108 [Candidatus Hydrogenedentes bacterium ADurb.Bin101]|nr:MAG: hypothetical protein BWX80_04108 [Candidatus Hydrogenedentes bacterium ADurb.Bin101]